MTIAVARSNGTTGRVARKLVEVCWQRGHVIRPSASIRQPALIARARLSASPSAARSACHEMQEPISHHVVGIRSSSPISGRTGKVSARALTFVRGPAQRRGAYVFGGAAADATGRGPASLADWTWLRLPVPVEARWSVPV